MKKNKVTPIGDFSWYVKWIASIVLIMGLLLRSAMIQPLDLYITLLGSIGWTYVGLLWHDRAIIVINVVASTIVIGGILTLWIGKM